MYSQETSLLKIMKKLDVLIINPSALNQIYQELSNEYAAIEPPIWAALIANHLRSKKIKVDILDCEGLGLNVKEAVARVKDYNPKLIVIVVYGQQPSASTQNMCAASLLCNTLKGYYPDCKVLLIGGHCSALPERTLTEEKTDFVCQGEGPYTITSLLKTDMESPDQLRKVPGLWFKEDGKAVQAPPSALIGEKQMEEELPGMAFDLLPMKNYRAHNWHCFDHISERMPYSSIYTSLGCPYKCTFCCINAPFASSRFRHWKPSFMIKQFDILANTYGIKNVKIADEMFVLKEKHFIEICKLLKERNYGFNIWAYSRVDTIKPSHLEALKSAGVNWIALGIESKSKFVRDGVSKGRFGEEDIYKVVKNIKSAGIHVVGNYIFGLPDDNYISMQETVDMALETNCEMSNFYSAMAYPGSQLYTMAIKGNWTLPESWLGYSQHAFEARPLDTKHITGGEVLGFRDLAWGTVFTSPKYLNLIKQKFGEKTLQHIKDLTKVKLKRKCAVTPKHAPIDRSAQRPRC